MRTIISMLFAGAGFIPAIGGPILQIPASASSFGLLGGSVSNTGTSLVIGNVGATSTITGFGVGTGTATGYVCTPTSGGPCTAGEDSAVTAAYNAIFSAGGTFSTGQGLSSSGSFTTATSQTFLGNLVYKSASDISTATGTNLIFDAQGQSNAVFVIQVNGAFTVNGAMTFTLENGAQADNIFWIVSDAATISVGSSGAIVFDGNILSGSSFTMSAAAGGSGVLTGIINGCVFATTANTLAGTTDVNGCSSTSAGGGGGGIPEPGSLPLTALGSLLALTAWRRRVTMTK
jgi:MYXO-CTERM domain-containing protein